MVKHCCKTVELYLKYYIKTKLGNSNLPMWQKKYDQKVRYNHHITSDSSLSIHHCAPLIIVHVQILSWLMLRNLDFINLTWHSASSGYPEIITWSSKFPLMWQSALKIKILLVSVIWLLWSLSRQSNYFLRQSQDYFFHLVCLL